jgi:hypothetical protein
MVFSQQHFLEEKIALANSLNTFTMVVVVGTVVKRYSNRAESVILKESDISLRKYIECFGARIEQ